MKTKPTKRTVNDALGVSREVAAKFRKFCRDRGLQISFATEQALAAWMREQGRTGLKGSDVTWGIGGKREVI